jgi:excisionase family DNA binding protein
VKRKIATPPEIVAPDLLTEQQIAALLNIEPRTLRLWRQTRGLPHLKLTSKIIRYRRTDVDAWLDNHRVAITA